MADERIGVLTPEQEAILDKLLKFNNNLAESLDGPAISLIDNQGIERLLDKIDEKNPDVRPIVLQIVDLLFSGLGQLIPEEEEED